MIPARRQTNNGFTLIELLIVIAIIAILAVVAFVALNPGRRFADARDAARWTDVTAILDAAKVDQVDNGGAYLGTIVTTTAGTNYQIGTGTGATGCPAPPTCDVSIAAGNCVDLTGLATEGYLAQVPVSQAGAGTTPWSAATTGYYLNKSTTGALAIGACESENTAAIKVTR